MKNTAKIGVPTGALLLVLAFGANAQDANVRMVVTTAADAGAADDDTRVLLEGTLVKKLSADTYEFKDATGSVPVEIDAEDLPQAKVDATTRVRLQGEVDRDERTMEVDVKRVEVI